MKRLPEVHIFAGAVAAVGGLLSAFSGEGGSSSNPSAPLPTPLSRGVERGISPTVVNPAVTRNTAANFVVTPDPGAMTQNRLFVMLPGTGGIPRFYRQIVRTGSQRGYHAIGLTYPNDAAVGDRCVGNTDPDCAGKARREILTGVDHSPVVSVDRNASIIGRLEDLIRHLDAVYPSEGWGQFLVSGQLDWSHTVVAGHSQGAGHAAYLGKLYALERIVMFSGPSDLGLTARTPAQWPSLPNVTPASRQFGFIHSNDELVPLRLVGLNWAMLGLSDFGPDTSVDGTAPPYGSSRRLVTSAPPNPDPVGPVPNPRHSSPVLDAVTPLDAHGAPLYRPVWVHMAFPQRSAVDLRGSADPSV